MGDKAVVEFDDGLGRPDYSEEKRQKAVAALNAIDWEKADRELQARKDADKPDYNGPLAADPTIM